MNDRAVLGALGTVVAAVTMLGIPAHATYGARAAVDEPQYLLTAMSLGDDQSLDISDELAAEAYRSFHRVDLPRQTYPQGPAGRETSPHDPLLPVLLAGPMKFGGWAAAKATIALMAGALAALTAWTASRRFGVSPLVAVGVVAAFSCAAPLATYATQVYPELPAALAVMATVAAVAAVPRGRSIGVVVVAGIALPWLSVKYAPVSAALVAVTLWRWRKHPRVVAAVSVVMVVAGAVYLALHRQLYGGWTSYASSGPDSSNGEFSAVGGEPNFLGRSRRLVGLLVDDGFGIALWMPAWLLVPVGVGVVWRRRGEGAAMILVPLATAWCVATFVALTMHGWWWPGRQIVVVLPLAAIAVGVALDSSATLRRVFVPLAAAGVVTWLWTTIEAITRRRVLIVDFERTSNPLIQRWRLVLPDGRTPTAADTALLVAWTLGVALLVNVGVRCGHGATDDRGRDATMTPTAASRSGLLGTNPTSF